MEATQINTIQGVPRPPFAPVIAQSHLFCTKLAKMNISTVKVFVQRNFWNFKTTLL